MKAEVPSAFPSRATARMFPSRYSLSCSVGRLPYLEDGAHMDTHILMLEASGDPSREQSHIQEARAVNLERRPHAVEQEPCVQRLESALWVKDLTLNLLPGDTEG